MDIQEQLDSQVEQEQEAPATVADKPLLTDEAIRNDQRKTDVVEVNFSDQSARVVGTSDAPKLTLDVIKEKADPVQDADMVFDTKTWTVRVKMGVPYSLSAKHAKLLERFKDVSDPNNLANMHRSVKELYVAEMIDAPKFSFQGIGKGRPVEECSDLLIEALWLAYTEKNAPIGHDIHATAVDTQPLSDGAIAIENDLSGYQYQQDLVLTVAPTQDAELSDTQAAIVVVYEDSNGSNIINRLRFTKPGKKKSGNPIKPQTVTLPAFAKVVRVETKGWKAGDFSITTVAKHQDIYQVAVLRGQPIHASLLLSETFELFPVIAGKLATEMTDAEVEQMEQRSLARRRIFVSSMVFGEGFSFSLNGEPSGESQPVAIEDISEQFLETLFQAYRVTNVPAAGLDAAHRFQGI